MSLANPSFPSSEAFDLINNSLKDDPKEKKDAIKKAGAIFAFTLKNKEGASESWYIDLKEKGEVGKGAAPESGKADVTLLCSDEDFGKLVRGTAKAQSLFMAGKLKIRGDIMKATRLEPILGKAQTKAKL
ncbi:SCP-2 sterol transfer family protein [Tothia fuscella]|uniref:SCP-2 sterol transfer family protein n=1 Tax=Tothia fuscella TaxID=1048955 RepID=A0A9P4NZU7_9PEZI|nr:SCP-2 sterol transfer family protein [Tothia fuscella]